MNTQINFVVKIKVVKLKKLKIDIDIDELNNYIKESKQFIDKIMVDKIMVDNSKIKNNHLYKTCKSNKIVLDIETNGRDNILQIAYNMYDKNNNIIMSKDFYIYDGIHSTPYYPTINESEIIQKGISEKNASDIITLDINNTDIIIGHNIKTFDLRCINKLNTKCNNKLKDNLIIHDTMISSRNIVNAKNIKGHLKNPTLEELMRFTCNKSVKNYHNAIGDVNATFECYKILCDKYECFKLTH